MERKRIGVLKMTKTIKISERAYKLLINISSKESIIKNKKVSLSGALDIILFKKEKGE